MTQSQHDPHPHRITVPRLTIGIISARKAGVVLGQTLERCGHRVTYAVTRSPESVTRAHLRLPNAQVSSIADTASTCELIVIAVPDRVITEVTEEVARYAGPGRIVMHTSGSLGRAVLDPVTFTGALIIAAHPAMAFAGLDDDSELLTGYPWGITVGDELAKTVSELPTSELGGRSVFINERHHGLYHAAMAHGSNGLGAVVVNVIKMLTTTIGGNAAAEDTDLAELRRGQAAELLRPLLEASLDNILRWGSRGLTGPVTRDDPGTVVKHKREIEAAAPEMGTVYLTFAERIAELRGANEVLRYLCRRAERAGYSGHPGCGARYCRRAKSLVR